jgi:hypothetical protein
MIHEVSQDLIGSGEKSLVSIYLKGLNKASVNMESETKYLCTEGKVIFFIYKQRRICSVTLIPTMQITIPKATPYVDFSASGARMLALSEPAFDSRQVIDLPLHPKLQTYFGLNIDS